MDIKYENLILGHALHKTGKAMLLKIWKNFFVRSYLSLNAPHIKIVQENTAS
jgi:hypothetical protein